MMKAPEAPIKTKYELELEARVMRAEALVDIAVNALVKVKIFTGNKHAKEAITKIEAMRYKP